MTETDFNHGAAWLSTFTIGIIGQITETLPSELTTGLVQGGVAGAIAYMAIRQVFAQHKDHLHDLKTLLATTTESNTLCRDAIDETRRCISDNTAALKAIGHEKRT